MGRYDRIAELADLADLAERPWPAEPAPAGPAEPESARPPVTRRGGVLEVADLATGYGRTVRAMLAAASVPIRVHAVDAAANLDDDLLHDERVRSVMADLDQPLPFPDGALDRVVSVNVAEHVADARAHVADCFRVLRPGGLLVLSHSDWDTTLFTGKDDALTRRLVDRFVETVPQWAERADGFMGRKLLTLADAAPFVVENVETWADCHRRFDDDSVAWKVARGVLAAAASDAELGARAVDWFNDLRQQAVAGRFLFTVIDVTLVLRRPV